MFFFKGILIVMLIKIMHLMGVTYIYTMIYVMQIQRGLGLQGIHHSGEDI